MGRKQFNQLLLVEGNDDVHIMYALAERFDIPHNFNVVDKKGIDNLLKGLPLELKSRKKAIGILLDADQDLEKRWNTVSKILKNAGYEIPDEPQLEGTIVSQENKPTVGIWLMPNNQAKGMIEDFMQFLIPEGDDLLPKAEKVLAELEEKGVSRYKTIHRSKALIHTWLAWQEDPGTPMGLAITKSYFSTENKELCELYVKWIIELFKD